MLVLALQNNGQPDTSFGSAGAVWLDPARSGSDEVAKALVVQPGGELVLAGSSLDAALSLAPHCHVEMAPAPPLELVQSL